MRLGLGAFTFAGLLCFLAPAWGQSTIQPRRVAQLAQPQATTSLSPSSVKNGVLRKRTEQSAIAPLTIQTPASADYVLKLVNARNDMEEMLIYVRRGSSYKTKVPLGAYKIRGAFGETWYGEKHLCGADTSYFKLVQKDGKSDRFAFHRTGNRVNGYIVQLIQQVAGNLDTSTIKPEDF
jgi:hypothetical protein